MRKHMLISTVWLLSATALAKPQTARVDIPNTPVGNFVSAWLTAYNSADPATIKRYLALYPSQEAVEDWTGAHAMTGRITPVKVDTKSPYDITVLVSAESGDGFWQDHVTVDPSNPMKPTNNGFGQADRPPGFAIARLPHAELERLMTRKLTQDVVSNRFAGTIIVERHAKIIYKNALGFADRLGKAPVTMTTKFRLGSANKMFTAIGVLQLFQQGKVSLDAPIGTYLKDYPNADFAKSVTVRHLLTHTGGAGDIFTPEYEAKRLQVHTLSDYVTLFGQRAPDTSENGKGAYANYGFILLGRLVEVVSGEDYYAYVRKHILAPAGMNDTGSLPEETAVHGRSHGYTKDKDSKLVDNADTLPWRASSAGGGYTTAADMIRFADALRSGKLLSKAILAQATSPQRPDGWYGFGFMVGDEGPTLNWGHKGGAPGMNAVFRVYPKLDAVLVVLANLDPPAAEIEADFYGNRMALGE